MKYLILFLALLFSLPTTVLADVVTIDQSSPDAVQPSQRELGDAPIEVQPGQAVAQVNGVVCSFCAYGIEKHVGKLDFLDTSQFTNGLFIDIDRQQITLALLPGRPINVPAIHAAVITAGYEPVRFHLRLEGHIEMHNSEAVLRQENADQQFVLTDADLGDSDLSGPVVAQVHIDAVQVITLAPDDAVPVVVDRLEARP